MTGLVRSAPLVSVVIPAHNCERYLAGAIHSVLDQTYHPVQVIVVDDGATDGTAEVARGFNPPIRYLHQPNAGTGAARNQGVRLAHGSLLAFLDADDLWAADKLALQTEALATHPEVEAVFGHVRQFYSPDLEPEMRASIECPERLMPGYLPFTMLVRRESFFRIGWFETHWRVGADMSWMLRAGEQELRSLMLPELVYWRRLHGGNKGITQRQWSRQRVRILKASLDRRRQARALDREME